MADRSLHRQLLLSTAALVGVTSGYSRSAYAICDTSNQPIVVCSGAQLTIPQVFNYNNAAVSTVSGFEGVDTTLGGGGNAISITGEGTLSYTDYYGAPLISDETALDIQSTGNNGVTPGSVTVNTNGTLTGGTHGIRARNNGTGALDISASGDVTGTSEYGIYAFGLGGGDVSVTATGNVKSDQVGISAYSSGGDTMVNNYGDVTTDGGGINATAYSGKVEVQNSGDVTVDGGAGIFARGSDDTTVKSAGDFAVGSGYGIIANSSNGLGDATVISYSDITGTGGGLRATSSSGEATVINNGDIAGGGGVGIQAASFLGDATVKNNGDVTSNTNAIRAEGAGDVKVWSSGDLTSNGLDGIYAFNNSAGGPIDISVASTGSVTSKGTAADDFAVDTGGGATTLTVAGTLNGGAGGAVQFDENTAFANRLELHPTAIVNGTVFAGPGTEDTLAFGGTGNGEFDLSKIATPAMPAQQFQNFDNFEVVGGTWNLMGETTVPFAVTGGTLEGTGIFGGLTVTGGTLAPGNSIGTMIVNGALALGGGAVFEVEVDAAGNNDKVIVNGTVNLTGATLKVIAANGNYDPKTDYTIIENDGTDAVVGAFGSVSTNLAFLTPEVNYAAGDGNDVVLTLLRNTTLFPDVAQTKNQKAVAGALSQFPTDNPLYLAILEQTAAGARQAFDALSGEIHATVAGTLVDDSRYAREAVMGRMMQASHLNGALGNGGPRSTDQVAGYDNQGIMLGGAGAYDGKSLVEVPQSSPLAFWTEGYGAWGTFDGDGNAATADRNLGGFISGMDADVWNGWRVGIATGASFSDVSVDQRYSGANTKTYHLGGYVNGDVGGLALRGGGLWAWSEIETSRAVVFPNFFERQKADYDADTGQLFGEIAYPTQMGGVDLEPFAGLAFVSVESSGFRERGGPEASLRTGGFDQDVGYTSVGLRAATTVMWGAMAVTPHIEAAWLHAFDDVTPGASLAFATTGIGFAIDGVPLAEDSAILDTGLDFAVSERLTAGVSYTGQYANSVSDNGVKGRLTWLFN